MSIADKLQTVADNVPLVYQAGYAAGQAAGGGGDDDGSYDEGYAAGQQAEYDKFWDSITANGTRSIYAAAFAYWDGNIEPNRLITPSTANDMFRNNATMTVFPIDKVDFSESTTLQSVVQYCSNLLKFKADVSSATTLNIAFLGCTSLKELELTNIQENCTFASAFVQCYKLTDVHLTGTIGVAFDMNTPGDLTKDSITNVINVLSQTQSGLTVKFSTWAVNQAFQTAPGAMNGSTSAEWLALVNSRPNWTITLA